MPPHAAEPLDLRNLAFFCVKRNSVVMPFSGPLPLTLGVNGPLLHFWNETNSIEGLRVGSIYAIIA